MQKNTLIKMTFILLCLFCVTEVIAIENIGIIGECFINAGPCRESKIINNYAYVGCQYGLMILDISDTSNPFVVGSYQTPSACVSIDILGIIAILACGNDGLFVLNISNPNNPVLLSTFDLQNQFFNASKIKIYGNIAFVRGAINKLFIIDISDVNNLNLLAYDESMYYRDFVVDGDFIYAVKDDLYIIDISQIDNPILFSSLDCCYNGYTIEKNNNYLYIGADGELKIINASNPSDPFVVNILDDLQSTPYNILIDNNTMYISSMGLTTLDISDPENPNILSEFDYPGSRISKKNDIIIISRMIDNYLAYNGIGIINVEDPCNMNLVSELKTCRARELFYANNYAYVANGFRGLTIVNVSNPHHPTFESNFETINKANSVFVESDIAYVAVADSGFQIIDVSVPNEPILLSAINPEYGDFRSIDKYSNYLYLGGEWTGSVFIYDVTDPANPFLVNQLNVNDFSYDITIHDVYLYTAGYWGGLQIFDLTDPVNPFEVGYYPLDLALSVEANENIAFIGANYSSLQIFDTTNINNPILASNCSIGYVGELSCINNTLYASSSTGLHIYNVSNPYSAYELGNFPDCFPKGTYPTENYVYCAESFRFSVFGDTTLVSINDNIIFDKFDLSNYPNPFNPTTTIKFSIKNDSKIELSIYNIKGQKVKILIHNDLGVGSHSIIWNGDDEYNNPVSSGIYCYKLNINGKDEVVKKCLLLK